MLWFVHTVIDVNLPVVTVSQRQGQVWIMAARILMNYAKLQNYALKTGLGKIIKW
jgi:hypothetical protein